jgi:hypothetical protein
MAKAALILAGSYAAVLAAAYAGLAILDWHYRRTGWVGKDSRG